MALVDEFLREKKSEAKALRITDRDSAPGKMVFLFS